MVQISSLRNKTCSENLHKSRINIKGKFLIYYVYNIQSFIIRTQTLASKYSKIFQHFFIKTTQNTGAFFSLGLLRSFPKSKPILTREPKY